jgi:hypothetical protein
MKAKLIRRLFVHVSVLFSLLICGDHVEAQFMFTTNNGSITITGYTGPGGNVIIPGVTNGYPVTAIGAGAFSGQSTMTIVTIPNSISSLGNQAFYNCSSLASVTIPGSVTNLGVDVFDECAGLTNVTIGCDIIGDAMFRYCFSLTSLTIPNNITSIGDYAFLRCYNLTNLTIGSSVTNIGTYAFSECFNLQQAYFQGNAPTVDGTPGSMDSSVFYPNNPSVPPGTVYYVPGTTGWGATFGGWPSAGWYQSRPRILGQSAQTSGFQFTISWATNGSIVVEASTNLALPVWTPLATNSLVNGTNFFSDSKFMAYPRHFYRARAVP